MLTPEEIVKLENIGKLYSVDDYVSVVKYAKTLVNDKPLFKKVAGYKKSTLNAVAYDADDAPLCDQLLFLYEWHTQTCGEEFQGVFHRQQGKWTITDKGVTKVDVEAGPDDDYISAVQPYM